MGRKWNILVWHIRADCSRKIGSDKHRVRSIHNTSKAIHMDRGSD